MTPEERSSIENGIWLCRSCARLIDSDERVYSVELLRMWKYAAEYEQSCIINQTDNWLKTNVVFENRKNIACRKAKEVLDNLHGILQYAYEYWNHNFENRHYGSFLENELMEHWVLYEDDLKRIYTFQEKRVLLNEVLLEYSLDLGPEICQEINNYCNYLNFYDKTGKYTGKGAFTIVEEAEGKGASLWGLLKSYQKNRDGWISLDYVHRI